MMTTTASRHTWPRRLGKSAGVCWECAGHRRPRRGTWEAGDDLGKPQSVPSPITPARLKIYFHPEGNQSVVILTYSLMCSLAIVTDILLLVMLPAVTNGIFAVKEVVFKEKHPSFSAVTEFSFRKNNSTAVLAVAYELDIFRVQMCTCILNAPSSKPLSTQEATIFLLLLMQWIISLGIHYSQ